MAVMALAAALLGCSGSSANPDEVIEGFKPDPSDPKLKERLAQDDGYALAVLYGADIHGSLETCG
jgi:hypothetical protein